MARKNQRRRRGQRGGKQPREDDEDDILRWVGGRQSDKRKDETSLNRLGNGDKNVNEQPTDPSSSTTTATSTNECFYDVCIVGAGPAGLATLSALQESFTMDDLTEQQKNHAFALHGGSHKQQHNSSSSSKHKVAVVDPSGTWLSGWRSNFATLDIKFLRSPALAHPDAFDETALLAYAVSRHRDAELHAAGCADVARLRGFEALNRVWDVPSTRLFDDFCRHTAATLPHDLYADQVVAIKREPQTPKEKNNNNKTSFVVELANGQRVIRARHVVLAMGAVGTPVLPPLVQQLPRHCWKHWKDLSSPSNAGASTKNRRGTFPSAWRKILVLGGGLTAVQVAQLALSRGGRRVVLCSRRPLVEKHLDIGLEWVDRRTSQKCQADFYHQPLAERLAQIKQARNGGSVPPYYMREVEDLEQQGLLQRVVGNPALVEVRGDDNDDASASSSIVVDVDGTRHEFDGVVVACGVQPQCRTNPLYQKLLETHEDAQETAGFPMISEDLEWFDNVYVVGGMASLNLGPDAGNLMGMRRGAALVANAMGCRSWMRETGKVLDNRFSLLFADEHDLEEDSSGSISDVDNDDDDPPSGKVRQTGDHELLSATEKDHELSSGTETESASVSSSSSQSSLLLQHDGNPDQFFLPDPQITAVR